MPSFKVAHLREQGQDMIIVPLNTAFDRQSDQEKEAFIVEMQLRCQAAGLAGTVVPIWPVGTSMKFIAPNPWHSFFQSIDYRWALANINTTVSW